MSNVLINGVQYGWGNITMVLFGSPVIGITKIDYSSNQKKDNIYGWNRDVIGRGYGNFEYSGSIEIYLEEWKKICDKSPNGNPLQIPSFNVTILFGGDGVIATQDKLYNVEFLRNPMGSGQNDTSIKLSIPLIIGGIERFV